MRKLIRISVLLALTSAIFPAIPACGQKRSPQTRKVNAVLVDAIIQTHNERVEQIDRVWARVSVRIKGTDARGKGFEEQGEGHLQVTRPSSVSLTIGKLSETYFVYGSSDERYWMFDLTDSDQRVALIGAVENLTPDRAEEIGLSVHPGDLISSLGIEPLDPERIVSTRWQLEEELVVIAQPSRWGVTEYWFDPRTALVVWVVSLDDTGSRIAETGLSRYKDLLDDQRRDSGIKIPGKVEMKRSGTSGEFVRIELSEPSQKAIKSMVYNPDRLKRSYRIHETIDLDAPAEPALLDQN
ncbi:MAG: hypothetical protein JJ974_02470 [Phycisphaerales bacterium]|nr:hypothetical protein [Phycisphaerales bacterium]